MSQPSQTRRIGSLVNQLMARRGYAQVVANQEIHQVIAMVVGPSLEGAFEVGKLQAGVLHIYVGDSVTMQEFNFQKRSILSRLTADLPDSKVTDLRFRIQTR